MKLTPVYASTPTEEIRRVGVFGGTFDPVHHGHILAADEARRRLRLEAVLFIPALNPPHRDAPRAAYEDRLRMLYLALQSWPALIPCPLEYGRSGPSFTVDTLNELHRRLAPVRLVLLLGNDQYAEMSRWHQPERIAELAHIVVISRPETRRPSLFPKHKTKRVRFLDVVPVSIAATFVRRQFSRHASVRYLCPSPVVDYCIRNNLYQFNMNLTSTAKHRRK